MRSLKKAAFETGFGVAAARAKTPLKTTNSIRGLELLRRAGIDPAVVDSRPLNVIMNDEIPYAKWDKQANLMKRAGYKDWQDFQKRRSW